MTRGKELPPLTGVHHFTCHMPQLPRCACVPSSKAPRFLRAQPPSALPPLPRPLLLPVVVPVLLLLQPLLLLLPPRLHRPPRRLQQRTP